MSLIDPALLSGLSRVQPQARPEVGKSTQQNPHHLFDQSLEALLTPQPANDVKLSPDSGRMSSEVAFSKHATSRLNSRGLNVDAQEQERLKTAVNELSQRGAKESLILLDDRAYVVGVPKRTVITVMSREEAMGQVFTNIDSTYVAV